MFFLPHVEKSFRGRKYEENIHNSTLLLLNACETPVFILLLYHKNLSLEEA